MEECCGRKDKLLQNFLLYMVSNTWTRKPSKYGIEKMRQKRSLEYVKATWKCVKMLYHMEMIL